MPSSNYQRIADDPTAKSPAEVARRMMIEYLREAAEDQGLTRDELADRAGLHRTTVIRMFQHQHKPLLDVYLKLAGALNLRIEVKPQAVPIDGAKKA